MTITLDRDEAITILEEIAREAPNAMARIAAIRQLEAWRAEANRGAGDDELYRDEFTARRKAAR